MKKIVLKLLLTIFAIIFYASPIFAAQLTTSVSEILSNPAKYDGQKVNVNGIYTGWKNAPSAPPISRSDWVICDEGKKGIYCTGMLPQVPETFEPPKYGDKIGVLAEVMVSPDKIPYLKVLDFMPINNKTEEMVSVMQVLLNAPERVGDYVSIMGVLAKGYGVKGDRQYLIADPTGVLRLGRLPKLYPTGTILHVSGVIDIDENGLPYIDQIEILSAKVD